MPARQRVRTAFAIVKQMGGYKAVFDCEHSRNKQEQMLNVACETLSRYMLGEIDDDQDFDGLDLQCLDIASKIRTDPEWNALYNGDRFSVRHTKVQGEDGRQGYFLWLDGRKVKD